MVAAGAIKRAQEFAVTSEITQMSQAVESFRSKYGFYPPSFEGLSDAESQASFLAFLTRVAPNHRELTNFPSGGTRFDGWWASVGCKLDQTTTLQFWLAGLNENKQFPLTGGVATADDIPVGYNEILRVADASLPVANRAGVPPAQQRLYRRESFFEFEPIRIIPRDTSAGAVATYNMEFGRSNGDLLYLYRDSASYRLGSPAYHFVGPNGAAFANPDTFQLISAGLDGDPGIPTDAADLGNLSLQLPRHADNLCNFADGRLDKYITENEPVNQP